MHLTVPASRCAPLRLPQLRLTRLIRLVRGSRAIIKVKAQLGLSTATEAVLEISAIIVIFLHWISCACARAPAPPLDLLLRARVSPFPPRASCGDTAAPRLPPDRNARAIAPAPAPAPPTPLLLGAARRVARSVAIQVQLYADSPLDSWLGRYGYCWPNDRVLYGMGGPYEVNGYVNEHQGPWRPLFQWWRRGYIWN